MLIPFIILAAIMFVGGIVFTYHQCIYSYFVDRHNRANPTLAHQYEEWNGYEGKEALEYLKLYIQELYSAQGRFEWPSCPKSVMELPAGFVWSRAVGNSYYITHRRWTMAVITETEVRQWLKPWNLPVELNAHTQL